MNKGEEITNDDFLVSNFQDTDAWGLAVSLDLAECNPKTIRDPKKLKTFLIDVCKFIDMKRFGEPTIVKFGDNKQVEGYSIVQLIETSCITGHFIDRTNGACIDIFSCKSFPPEKTVKFCKTFFEAKNARFTVLNRYCD
jgi:S-adenosylmethionine/arginine decarboxylase-like enzyme